MSDQRNTPGWGRIQPPAMAKDRPSTPNLLVPTSSGQARRTGAEVVVVGGTVVVGGLVVVGGTVVVGGLVVVGGTVVVGASAVVVGWVEVEVEATVVVDCSVVVPPAVVDAAASEPVEVVVGGVDAVSAAPAQAPARRARANRPVADRLKIAAAAAFAVPGVLLPRRWPSPPAGRCPGPVGRRPGPPGSWRCGMGRSHNRPR